MTLSTLAGWNQTESDWRLLLRLDPEGCVAGECDGRVVATTTLICYGDQLAWLGMVLTHPDYRRRGFARCMVKCALEIAERRGVRSVKLDATDQGRPLYERFGFRREQAIERWSGIWPVGSVVPRDPAAILDFSLDQEAFGADRSRLLGLLAESAHLLVTDDGFVMSRPGAHASFLGPCVSRSVESARLMIERCLSAHAGAWFWDLFPSNYGAVQLAKSLGFKPERRLVRMVKGQDVRGNELMINAGGGFELG